MLAKNFELHWITNLLSMHYAKDSSIKQNKAKISIHMTNTGLPRPLFPKLAINLYCIYFQLCDIRWALYQEQILEVDPYFSELYLNAKLFEIFNIFWNFLQFLLLLLKV